MVLSVILLATTLGFITLNQEKNSQDFLDGSVTPSELIQIPNAPEVINSEANKINDNNYSAIKNFKQYDDRYTAPIHGFNNAEDYWEKCSSRQFIPDIKTPTLIVNALNDPFLGKDCYPHEEAADSEYVFLETPKSGGHMGFIEFNRENRYWSEKHAVEFLNKTG